MAWFFILGIQIRSTGIFGEVLIPILKNSSTLTNYISGLTADVEQITIDVAYRDYQKLAYQRHQGLENNGIMKPEYHVEVPAKISYLDNTYKAKIRIKGDLSDHWEYEEKWSLRISLKGDNTIFGMKRFSIQHPKTRNYIFEWIYQKALKKEQLIGLRYKFLNVTINGKDQGTLCSGRAF